MRWPLHQHAFGVLFLQQARPDPDDHSRPTDADQPTGGTRSRTERPQLEKRLLEPGSAASRCALALACAAHHQLAPISRTGLALPVPFLFSSVLNKPSQPSERCSEGCRVSFSRLSFFVFSNKPFGLTRGSFVGCIKDSKTVKRELASKKIRV